MKKPAKSASPRQSAAASTEPRPTGNPVSHTVLIAVVAYTERMAERIKQQAENLFAECSVSIVAAEAAAPEPGPASPVLASAAAPAETTTTGTITSDSSATITTPPAEPPPPPVYPIGIGATLTDRHVPDRKVTVIEVAAAGFTVSDSAAVIPWESLGEFEAAAADQAAPAKPARKAAHPKTKHVPATIPARSARRQRPAMLGAHKPKTPRD